VRDDDRQSWLPRGVLIWVGVAIALLVYFAVSGSATTGQSKPELDSFFALIRENRLESVRILGEKVVAYRRDTHEKLQFSVPRAYVPTIIDALLKRNESLKEREKIRIYTRGDENPWAAVLVTIGPIVLLMLFFYLFFFRQMRSAGGGGLLSFGRSRAKVANKDKMTVTFADVAGIDEAKDQVKELIEFLRNPRKFERLGGRVPRGVLLMGPPGTGKTLLAKAIAGEADRPFLNISGSDFVEMFVGVGASRVRDLFNRAKQLAPCIVFLDEIDAVGRRRGTGLGGGHDEREQTLNQILVEMDGFGTDDKVIVIAATNRPDVLDPALLRPGRFDRTVVVDLPDVRGREEILKVHARGKKLSPTCNLSTLARSTPYFSGADLENLLNEAAILAALKGKQAIEPADLEEAREKVQWGPEKRSRIIVEEDKRIIAYHESGHAIVAKLVPDVEPIHKVTIIPRGTHLGATMHLPERDRYLLSRKRILGDITVALGGRAAEELFCADVTSGAQNDLERATELARMMVCKWGMDSQLGPLSYAQNEEHLFLGREVTRVQSMSEWTMASIDAEIRKIVETCYERAKGILAERRTAMEELVKLLLKQESVDAATVGRVLAGEIVA